MSKDLTPKQEKFCQLVVELGNKSEAYRQAYNSKAKHQTVNVSACKLLADPRISLRVKEIRDELRERNRATLDDILDELADNHKFARQLEQPTAMNQATLGKAKLLGFDKQVIEHSNPDGTLKPTVIQLVSPAKKPE